MQRINQTMSHLSPSQTSGSSSNSKFAHVTVAPPNAIFKTKADFKADSHPDKVNLGIGAYRTEQGKPLVLDVVRKVERELATDLTTDHEYAPITGDAQYVALSQKLILGNSRAVVEGRVAGVQTLSGTGALRVGFEFISKHLPKPRIYFSNPTWGNHGAIIREAGLESGKYSYYKPSTRGLDYEGLIHDFEAMPRGSVVLLHACAHNPTGVDPTQNQWRGIADVMQRRGLIPFFDSAYQGYASGSLDDDAWAVRLFETRGFEMFIAQSFSKNLGLYGERAGCLSLVTSTPHAAKAVKSQLALVIRPMYSNPPRHGAEIVKRVLGNPANFAAWKAELKGMSDRILEMRQLLRSELERLNTPGDWSHVTNHIGMFTYTGLTPTQVQNLTKRWHVYLLASGRISVAGLSTKTARHLAKGIHDVVINP